MLRSEPPVELIAKLKPSGISIILISHKMSEVMRRCDRVERAAPGPDRRHIEHHRNDARRADMMVGRAVQSVAGRAVPAAPHASLWLQWPDAGSTARQPHLGHEASKGRSSASPASLGDGQDELLETIAGISGARRQRDAAQ